MNPEHLFVGGVSITLGMTAIVVSIGNWDACYRLAKIRWIESWGGRRAARWSYALIGVALIALGIAIATGFGPNATRGRQTMQVFPQIIRG
jgi:hypothetical protein